MSNVCVCVFWFIDCSCMRNHNVVIKLSVCKSKQMIVYIKVIHGKPVAVPSCVFTSK